MVIFSTLFLLVLATVIAKLVYDHQLAKDMIKIDQYKHLNQSEDTDENIY